MTDSDKRVTKWADSAMFEAEPVASQEPQVYLLEMTSDPLGSIAALSAMYTGKVVRSKDDVTDAERDHHLEEMRRTKLTTPLESVKLHFMLEGVTRAFTHQLVRNRTSAYAQESMRFAVKEDMPVQLPPSLAGTLSEAEVIAKWDRLGVNFNSTTRLTDADLDMLQERDRMRILWDRQVQSIRSTYNQMVDMGMPAEDARGLAPTNVLTRINWVTDLRTLIDVLGVRLCTQAQFEWRLVATKIAAAIGEAYKMDRRWVALSIVGKWLAKMERIEDEYKAIASLFRPICYKTGKCEFMSQADRFCSIRDRVEANHAIGRPSSEWGSEAVGHNGLRINPIRPEEWMMDPNAARQR